MRQLHEEHKETIQSTTLHFMCKCRVRQGSIIAPILFSLFLQEMLGEVFPNGDNNGLPHAALPNKEHWTLRHTEYADDLVLVTDSPETAQELLT